MVTFVYCISQDDIQIRNLLNFNRISNIIVDDYIVELEKISESLLDNMEECLEKCNDNSQISSSNERNKMGFLVSNITRQIISFLGYKICPPYFKSD